jgi:branched-chain amino acid transport system substrate-binding protein
MNKINVVIVLVVVIILLGGLFTLIEFSQINSYNLSNSSNTIKIGFIGALTGSGAAYGLEEKQAIEIAVEKINLTGGINGKKIEVIYEDGKCSGTDALSAANKLINIDQVKIIFGGTCSGETLAFGPVAQQNKILVLNSFSLSSKVAEIGDYIFSNVPLGDYSAIKTAKFAMDNNHKRIAVVSEEKDYSVTFSTNFKKALLSLGGEIVLDDTYLSESKDNKLLASKIIVSKPDAVLISVLTNPFVLKDLKEQGYSGAIYGNTNFGVNTIMGDYMQYAEGSYFLAPIELDKNTPKIKEFFSAFKDKFGKEPGSFFWDAASYDKVFILKKAIELVGENSENLKNYFSSMDYYSGLIGNYKFDKTNKVIGIEVAKNKIVSGVPVVVN